jgi:signal transduction histidine kinase
MLPIQIQFCGLGKIVSDTLAELSAIHGDRFNFRLNSRIEGYWSCQGIRRILENLCSNAIKYGGSGQPVEVALSQNTESVSIAVHNKGPPIPSDIQAKLFEPFMRSEAAKKSGQSGWGLGLTLVKGIVEAHRGLVTVESTPQSGTTFRVNLPLDARGVSRSDSSHHSI